MDGSTNLYTEMERLFFFWGGGGGVGQYNSAFIPDRGTEQQVKINSLQREEGQLRKYSNFS